MSLSGPGDGGAPVAQPARALGRVDVACLVALAFGSLGLAIWAGLLVREACGGHFGAPLDDSYIHFQFARSFARFHPFEYSPGTPPVAGATSLLWPALLVPALWLGASGPGLIACTWVLGFGALFGQASEVYLASRRFLLRPLAFAAGVLVLSFSANTWFAASAMEVVPLGYLLLRTARRAAEYFEGQRTRWRRWELMALALAASLLRPEGALAALGVSAVLACSGKVERRLAALSLAAPLVTPLVNAVFTGSAAQTTTLAKWLPANPYYRERLGSAILANVGLFFDTLLDGRQWSWTFIPEGYRILGLACLPALLLAAERRKARVHGLLLCGVGLGILVPASYETFLVNRLRYLWPFSGPWLLGLAALGELLAAPLARLRERLAWLGLGLPALAAWGFAKLAPISVHDVAQSAAAIDAQQVSLGKWAAEELPREARIGVNDAGAISFYSGRRTFDVVGLTTSGEARYWVAGPGSRFEHYERLPRASLPTHFIVYPEWFGIPSLLGGCLTERRVDGATILGGPLMVACEADFASLGSGERPRIEVDARPLLDELDVADLESEAAHGYVVGPSSSQYNVVKSQRDLVDGGRVRVGDEFRLKLAPKGVLVIRLAPEPGVTTLQLRLGNTPTLTLNVPDGGIVEVQAAVPSDVGAAPTRVVMSASAAVTVLHYWSFGAPP